MTEPTKIGSVNYVVPDVRAAVGFYDQAIGLACKFQDGERYAAMDGQTTTLALVSSEESLLNASPAAAFKVADVEASLSAVVAAGGRIVSPSELGPHEVRALAEDPWGNRFIVYAGR
ncbi:VOC family protein [Rhodococcus wratislaviensis]|uniref:VOC domain-containing protein n=1 Tax=Rhodococcus wratislaviensis NBRC 100605 TaxID=1219028 RepID=X0PMC6_RHOWR|nr:VOC family protein [Rhodococcus wratislaviensis]GAF43603.1 hypothetical protein RW1_009_00270 [Rhodococcus wratislaviensis NBRC 100605]